MKIHYIVFFLLFFSSALAQTNKDALVQDPAAEPFLEQISKLFDADKALQIEFKYEVESAEPPSKVSDYGSIIIKGNKYKLKTDDGEMYFNGKTLWVYNIAAKEVYSSIPSGENMDDMLLSPFRLIKDFKTYYKYRLKEDVNMNGISYTQIELYPKDLNTSYSIMRILVNKKNGVFYSFSMQQKNGVHYTIYSREIIKDLKIPESTFSWNASLYPDVLEVEM
ncbi:MAG: outer membrane lipoprotein carrier protein LolA [Bacteroidales bacterium]|nr:outer membrane lipoprotein carrier protein LolA [Bacteroidales bacterium]MCB9012847.1 outer membrane lipoprotein carrier protein LolA [Bacteroidales bacterium]